MGSKPCGWLERIVLPAQDLGGGGFQFSLPDGGPDTDFDVAWRQ